MDGAWQTGSTLQQVGRSQAGFGQHTGFGGHGLHTGLGGHGGGHGLAQTGAHGFGHGGGQAGAHGFGHTGPCSQHDGPLSHVMWMCTQQILSLIFFNRQQSLLQQSTFACPQHPPIEPP